MFRLVNNLRCSLDEIPICYSNIQNVRWHRKPRWVPVAKSKIFKIPKKTVTPIEEDLELQRLNNNYRTQINSLRRYLFYKHNVQFLESEDPEQQKKLFEEDFLRCEDINNKWNEEQKVLREKRVQEEFEEELDYAKKRVEFEINRTHEKREHFEALVRREKEISHTFITPDNIDKAIETALNNPVDYNFALTPSGEKIFGRETNISSQVANVEHK